MIDSNQKVISHRIGLRNLCKTSARRLHLYKSGVCPTPDLLSCRNSDLIVQNRF